MKWRTIEEATTKRVEGCCVTSEKMLVKGLIDDEDYRIVEANTMVNRNLMCVPVSELNAPELKESDERIRKGAIKFLKSKEVEGLITYEARQLWIAYLEKQKELFKYGPGLYFYDGKKTTYCGYPATEENPKSADSIPSDCTSDAKCEDRWYKVADFLPDSGRDVLAKDALGNCLLASFDGDQWFVSVYDGEDKPIVYTPAIKEWCDIPSEKKKEQKPDWSEEDEEMLEYIIGDVNDAKQLYTTKEAKDMADKEIAWLKSLRPTTKK